MPRRRSSEARQPCPGGDQGSLTGHRVLVMAQCNDLGIIRTAMSPSWAAVTCQDSRLPSPGSIVNKRCNDPVLTGE
jgi:hypothetical protein